MRSRVSGIPYESCSQMWEPRGKITTSNFARHRRPRRRILWYLLDSSTAGIGRSSALLLLALVVEAKWCIRTGNGRGRSMSNMEMSGKIAPEILVTSGWPHSNYCWSSAEVIAEILKTTQPGDGRIARAFRTLQEYVDSGGVSFR